MSTSNSTNTSFCNSSSSSGSGGTSVAAAAGEVAEAGACGSQSSRHRSSSSRDRSKVPTHATPVEGALERQDGEVGTARRLPADACPQLLRGWWLTVALPSLGRRERQQR